MIMLESGTNQKQHRKRLILMSESRHPKNFGDEASGFAFSEAFGVLSQPSEAPNKLHFNSIIIGMRLRFWLV